MSPSIYESPTTAIRTIPEVTFCSAGVVLYQHMPFGIHRRACKRCDPRPRTCYGAVDRDVIGWYAVRYNAVGGGDWQFRTPALRCFSGRQITVYANQRLKLRVYGKANGSTQCIISPWKDVGQQIEIFQTVIGKPAPWQRGGKHKQSQCGDYQCDCVACGRIVHCFTGWRDCR